MEEGEISGIIAGSGAALGSLLGGIGSIIAAKNQPATNYNTYSTSTTDGRSFLDAPATGEAATGNKNMLYIGAAIVGVILLVVMLKK